MLIFIKQNAHALFVLQLAKRKVKRRINLLHVYIIICYFSKFSKWKIKIKSLFRTSFWWEVNARQDQMTLLAVEANSQPHNGASQHGTNNKMRFTTKRRQFAPTSSCIRLTVKTLFFVVQLVQILSSPFVEIEDERIRKKKTFCLNFCSFSVLFLLIPLMNKN